MVAVAAAMPAMLLAVFDGHSTEYGVLSGLRSQPFRTRCVLEKTCSKTPSARLSPRVACKKLAIARGDKL